MSTAPSPAARWLLGMALGLSIALVVGVLVAAAVVRGQRPGPLKLAAVPAPAAGSADCARLLSALPPDLEGDADDRVHRRELATPAPSGTAAWGEPPVVLRCGLGRPATLTATSRLLDVSGVQLFALPAADAPGTGEAGNWVVVDRPVYVVVTLPPDVGSGPLQQIAGVIGQTLPRRDLDLSR